MKRFLSLVFFLIIFSKASHAQLNQIANAQKILGKAQNIQDSLQILQQRANEIFDQALADMDKFGNYPLPRTLPLEKKTPPDAAYQLQLTSIVMQPYSAKAELFMRVDRQKVFKKAFPTERYLDFAATGVSFTKSGGFTGETSLILLGDAVIPLYDNVNLRIFAINPTNNSVTHAKFNCDGFEKLHLSAAFEISNQFVLTEDANGTVGTKPFYVEFEADVEDLDNWLFEINNIPPFQFKSLPDYSWSVKSLAFDNSLTANSLSMENPSDGSLWTGLFCKEVMVKMPTYLRSKAEKGARREIAVRELKVDQAGFSGNFSVNKVYEDGALGSWKYTIANISGSIKANRLDEFEMSGVIDMPIAKKETKNVSGEDVKVSKLEYKGRYIENRLKLEIGTDDDWSDLDFLNAINTKVYEPKFEVTVAKDELQASLSVRAVVGIDASSNKVEGKPSNSVLNLTLHDLKVQTQKPFLSIGSVEVASGAKISNFPVTITQPRITVAGDNLTLGLGLSINFMGKGDNSSSFGAKADFTLTAQRDAETDRWKPGTVSLGQACLKVDNKAFEFNGCLNRFNSKEYGEGFDANLNAKFIGKLEVSARAIFARLEDNGAVEGRRYWYVDAGLTFPRAIPIFTGVGLNGFYGGAYYNMTMCNPLNDADPLCKSTNASTIGLTKSGKRFVPVREGAEILGIRAGVGIVSTPTPEGFNGNVALGVEFIIKKDNSFSISKVTFDGMVKIINIEAAGNAQKVEGLKSLSSLTAASEKGGDCPSGLIVDWVTAYDVQNEILSGTIGLKVNVLNIIKGEGGQCSAGNTELYFSPKKWYVYMGRPIKPIGLSFVSVFSTKSYVIMGSELPKPAIAPLPGGAASSIDYGAIGTGGGFGFGVRAGADIYIRSPKISIKVCEVYGSVSAGFSAGADVLLIKNAEKCNGNDRGVNGWYAYGQAFVEAYARIDGHASCFGVGGKLTLAEFRLAANLQAQLPNPTYISGEVTAEARILGIGKELNFSFRFPRDNGCGAGATHLAVIKRVYPNVMEQTINGYQGIQLSLSSPVESSVSGVTIYEPSISFPNGEFKGSDFEKTKNLNKDEITFVPRKTMSGGTYKATITVPFSNGLKDEITFNFKVDVEEDRIPVNNVVQAYPLPNMKHFYRLTGKKGYINLKCIPNVPTTYDKTKAELVVQFYQNSTLVSTEKVTYNSTFGADNFSYNIPSDKFIEGSNYQLRLVRRPIQVTSSTTVDNLTGGSTTPSTDKAVVLLEYPFNTSKFSSFEEKAAAFTAGQAKEEEGSPFQLVPLAVSPTASTKNASAEPFSQEEFDGFSVSPGERIQPLVRVVNEAPCDASGKKVQPFISGSDDGGNELWLCKNQQSTSSMLSYFLPGRSIAEASYSIPFKKK